MLPGHPKEWPSEEAKEILSFSSGSRPSADIITQPAQKSEALRPQGGASRRGSFVDIVPLVSAYKSGLAGHVPAILHWPYEQHGSPSLAEGTLTPTLSYQGRGGIGSGH